MARGFYYYACATLLFAAAVLAVNARCRAAAPAPSVAESGRINQENTERLRALEREVERIDTRGSEAFRAFREEFGPIRQKLELLFAALAVIASSAAVWSVKTVADALRWVARHERRSKKDNKRRDERES
ncbi:MAG TPA: hypothetical protein VNN73_17555 [Blastocatellia bacterium]|nr:hypothetical protein [Blastocatellia bacterium]